MKLLLSVLVLLFTHSWMPVLQAPSAPTMVLATCADIAYGGTSCTMTFDPSGISNETRFEVWRKVTAGGTYELVLDLPAELKNASAAIRALDSYPGLTPNVEVFYKVKACNASGCSAFSGEVSATTQDDLVNYSGYSGADAFDVVPATPTSVTATNNTSTKNTITYSHGDIGTWDAGGDRLMTNTLWKVYRKISSDSDLYYKEIGQDYNGSYEDREIDLNVTYQYAVRACRRIGCSVFAESNTLATPTSYSAPVAALTVSSNLASGSSITVAIGESFVANASASTNVSDRPWGTYNEKLPYSISFGPDEDTYELREAAYAYKTSGTKTVTVTVYNPNGTSDTETATVIVQPDADTITTDAAHTCSTSPGDTSLCTTHKHRPPAGSANAFANALTHAYSGNKPLIELAKGQANEYIGQFSLLDRTGATPTTYITIQPLDYATNFTANKRVTSADSANLAWIKHNHTDNTLGAISTGAYGSFLTGEAEYYRIRGLGFRKQNEATLVSNGMIHINQGFGDTGPGGPSNTEPIAHDHHNIILQHIYIDTSANTTNYLKAVVYASGSWISILDSHLFGAKKLGDESYGIFITGSYGKHVYDNNLVYGSTMAEFYDGYGNQFGPEYMREHCTTRRSHLTRLLSDQSAVDPSVNHKNMWETKMLRFGVLHSTVISNWWSEDQQGIITITNSNQVGYMPQHTNNFLLIKNNVVRITVNAGDGTNYVQLYNRDSLNLCPGAAPFRGCSGYTDTTSHIYFYNNLMFSTPGITPPETFIFKGTFLGEPSEHIVARHNTVLSDTGDSIIHVNGEQLGSIIFASDFTMVDNIFFGSNAGATNASQGWNALTEYERVWHWRANATYGGLGSDTNYDSFGADDLYFPTPDNVTGIGFTDATNRDYRLSGSSAFRAGQSTDATDGTDIGANISTIYTQLRSTSYSFTAGNNAAEHGDWTQGATGGSQTRGKVQTKGATIIK